MPTQGETRRTHEANAGRDSNCFNGEGAPLSKPDQGFYLDGYYHGVLAVKSLPKTTYCGMVGQQQVTTHQRLAKIPAFSRCTGRSGSTTINNRGL